MTQRSEQPSFNILISLIRIWDYDGKSNPLYMPDNAMTITECENIEIEESYKKLIGTASVKFPRGTVIRKTVTQYNSEEVANDKKLTASLSDAGVVEEVRQQVSELAKTSNFKIGQRIRIYLGYTTDPKVAEMAKSNNLDERSSIYLNTSNMAKYMAEKSLHIMFDGYISKISVDTPIELHCENLASSLKKITCPRITIKSQSTVNDFLSDNGRYKMLKGTGLSLHPETEAQKFDLGGVDITTDLTVADVITEWAKYGIHGFVTEYNGKPVLAIGRSYFSNAKRDSIINANTQSSEPVTILFDYHVAENGLSLNSTDARFLAVEAQGLDEDNKFYRITVIKNPQYGMAGNTGGKYRLLNETKLSKKAIKLGITPLSQTKDKVSMDLYTKIPYHSRKIPVSKDDLIEEAVKYMESYNMNGIEGSLTLFGDLHLHTATKVRLVDKRFPGKNGEYLVDEVHTSFGTGGYRQTIKLPYCIRREKNE